jgi:large subunit ribosomal protein L7/L12
VSFLKRLLGRDDRDAMDVWSQDVPTAAPTQGTGSGAVRLVDPGTKLIMVIKAVRGATDLGLKEAKDLVDSAPVTVMTDRPQQFLAELEQAGATAHLEAPGPFEDPQAPRDYDSVHLVDPGKNKIKVIKVVREATGLGLKEAKDLVESAPVAIDSGWGPGELRRRLAEAGAQVD